MWILFPALPVARTSFSHAKREAHSPIKTPKRPRDAAVVHSKHSSTIKKEGVSQEYATYIGLQGPTAKAPTLIGKAERRLYKGVTMFTCAVTERECYKDKEPRERACICARGFSHGWLQGAVVSHHAPTWQVLVPLWASPFQ